MKKALLVAILVGAALFFSAMAQARASCSSEQTHVSMGQDFLNEARAYDARNEDELAAAEWENLGHQVEMASSDNMECNDTKVNRDYALLASWDSLHQATASAGNPALLRDYTKAFRAHLAELYHFGGGSVYAADYAALKKVLQQMDGLAHIPYCSPDKGVLACGGP